MPVRLTPRGSLLISYDYDSQTWVSIPGTSICILSHTVEVEPGTTLSHVFDIVERDKELKRFLADYCSCDIDAIHKLPRNIQEPILTFNGEWHNGFLQEVTADVLKIAMYSCVGTNGRTGDRHFHCYPIIETSSFACPDWGALLAPIDELASVFGTLCSLNLVLNSLLEVSEVDADKWTDSTLKGLGRHGRNLALRAHIRYTLLDVLHAIYSHFGKPQFEDRLQPEVELYEHLRRSQSRKPRPKSKPENDADENRPSK